MACIYKLSLLITSNDLLAKHLPKAQMGCGALTRRTTMNRDFESAAWAGGHHQLSGAVAAFVDKTADAFRRLQARQFDAPWRPARR